MEKLPVTLVAVVFFNPFSVMETDGIPTPVLSVMVPVIAILLSCVNPGNETRKKKQTKPRILYSGK
jgi:hypothetical protein